MAKKTKANKKTKKGKKAEQAPEPVQEPVQESAPETETVTETVTTATETAADTLASVQQRIDERDAALVVLAREQKRDRKLLNKLMARALREAQKSSKRKSTTKREPTGINKAEPVPAKVCSFLGLDAGTEMKRTSVTKKIYAYIKENNLQMENDKRITKPDQKLRKLFGLSKGENITFQTFQKHLAKLYNASKGKTKSKAL